MATDIFTFLDTLIKEPSWRKFSILLVVLLAGFIVAASFELYTGHLRLGKVERTTALLKELVAMSPEIQKTNSPELTEIFHSLTKELQPSVNHSIPSVIFPTWALKASAAAVPWILFAILIVLTKTPDFKLALQGILIGALPCVIGGTFLPDYGHLYNYVLYPFGIAFIVVMAVMIWTKLQIAPNSIK